MTCFNITAADIARDLNVSASLVRKHIDGDRECKSVDIYIIHRCFDDSLEVENATN
jgi:DNA-binding transcriptional regulator LsrR (DeoR family)